MRSRHHTETPAPLEIMDSAPVSYTQTRAQCEARLQSSQRHQHGEGAWSRPSWGRVPVATKCTLLSSEEAVCTWAARPAC